MSIPPQTPAGPDEAAAGAVSDRCAIIGLVSGAVIFAVLLFLPPPDGMTVTA